MIEEPSITQTAGRVVAMIHLKIPRNEIQTAMGPALREVFAAIKDQGVTPVGPWFTHHRSMSPVEFDFEVCVPVSSRVESVGRVVCGEFPAIRVVCTIHHGPYDGPSGLGAFWSEFGDWIRTHGYGIGPDLYECYLVGPESNPDPTQWRTELGRPLAG